MYATCYVISYVLSRPTCFHAVCWLPDVFICMFAHYETHTFLTYEVMSLRNCKLITPCLSHNFPQVHSKQSTTSRLFNLWTLLTMQLLTCKYVSVCKFSHMRTCLYATCHLISHVLSRLICFHTNLSPTRRVFAHVRTLQDECLHTFWLTKTCLCVTFNIWHHLFHLTTHICSRNDVCAASNIIFHCFV